MAANTSPTIPTPHQTLMVLIAQVVFVIILAELSQFNDMMEKIIMTFLIGLWMVYFVNAGPKLISIIQGKVGF